MPGSLLAPVTLDISKAERELAEYGQWLDSHAEFSEAEAVEFLKVRPNLCLLIQPVAGKGYASVFKREVALQGVLRADLITGSTNARHFVLVEFEGGTRDSIFNRKRGTGQMRDWSREVARAFSQVTDWSCSSSRFASTSEDNRRPMSLRGAQRRGNLARNTLQTFGIAASLRSSQ